MVDQLEKQIGQIAEFVGQFPDQGRLPSSTIANPKGGFESAKAITLRSGKEVEAGSSSKTGHKEDEMLQMEENEASPPTAKIETSLPQVPIAPTPLNLSNKGKNVSNSGSTNVIPLNIPFPRRFMQTKNEEAEKDILDTFRKVQVNIPLLDAIKQVPRYAKFLKELCTTRKRISNKEVVKVSENVSAILQRKLPPKCKDPGSFTISCVIGNNRFEHAMLDLGASINAMPYSIYASMNLGELKKDGVIIQLADRSNVYPKGVLEDVLVQVNQLIFPADFYVLDMEDLDHSPTLPILLGRPFMKTARTKIDVYNGTLTMEFDGEVIKFNISETMKFPNDDHSCFAIDIVDSLAQGYFDDLKDDALERVITRGMEIKTASPMLTHGSSDELYAVALCEGLNAVPWCGELSEMVAALESLPKHVGKLSNFESIPVSTDKTFPSVIQAPTLELKPLPSHLKYVYLGEQETLPVIVSSFLTTQEEEKLVRVLKEFKSVIALKYLFTKKEAKPRLIRWMLLLQEFDIEIKDKKGSDNVVADHLSRLVREEEALPISETFPDEQLLSIKVPIFVVEIFDVWGIDFMGPFPTSFGFTYILLAVDYVLKWVEAKATRTNDSRVVADFVKSNIFSRFGMPRVLISDGGSHFCNCTNEALLKKYNVMHKVSTPYHPQTSGRSFE
ncbi:uncharacterized protein [Malus domestica]|uniref:uncharacterized protein n=1 Tax=Malus domestica TaxID=3750 RepID=UPI00397663F1